jgi:hypothetical protein
MDTSYSPTALQFAEEVVRGAGLVNVKNGDELFVEFQAFPNKYPGWETGQDEGPMPVAEDPAMDKPLLKDIEDLLDEKLSKPKEEEEKNQKNNNTLMWVIIGLVSLLLIILLAQWIAAAMGKKRENSQQVDRLKTVESDHVALLQGKIDQLSDSIKNPSEKNLEIEEL